MGTYKQLKIRTVQEEIIEIDIENWTENEVIFYDKTSNKFRSCPPNALPYDPGATGLEAETIGDAIAELKTIIDGLS